MPRPRSSRTFAAPVTLVVAALLAGCESVPHVTPQEHALNGAAIGLEGPRIAPAVDWWRSLNDPQLDRITGEALTGNPTLDVALARLRLARTAVSVQHAGLLPQVSIDGQGDYARVSGKYAVLPPYGGTDFWLGSTQASLTWTLDFAGKQRALISQARHSADAASFDVAAARIALTGSVAQAYVGLARAELQIRIAQSFVESRQESLALAHTRSRNNLDNDFDIRAAETLLAEAQKSLDNAKGERALMTHALAALAGRGADAYSSIAAPTIRLDAALPLPASLPANLLDRRPDILAAQARIDAASAGRKAAKADFYPSVDLRAFMGASAIGLGSVVASKALAGGGGPSIHIPVFEGGRLRAKYRASIAELDEATASYNQLALQAVQQAADALSQIESTAAQAADQRKIEYGLTETVRLDRVRVRTGLGTQLDILSSGDQLLQARQTQADLDAEGLTHRIELLVAVGGDFSPSAPSKLAAADRDASTKARP